MTKNQKPKDNIIGLEESNDINSNSLHEFA